MANQLFPGSLRFRSAKRKIYRLRAGRLMAIMFYTYVLKSNKDGNLYIGWTIDLENRLREHNNGLVSATRGRLPLDLVYYEACLKKEAAISREKQLKTGFGRAYLKRRLN